MSNMDAERLKAEMETLNSQNSNGMSFDTLTAIMNSLDALIFACVPETCEIVFINERMKEVYGVNGGAIGKKCYKYLYGNNERCEFCPYSKMKETPSEVVNWETRYNAGKVYRMTAMMIDWPGGGKVHLEFGVEITDCTAQTEMLENILNGMDALITVADPETFEVLFLNDSIRNYFGIEGSGVGEICYKVLQKRSEPCVSCPYAQLIAHPGESLSWEHVESVKGSVLQKTARLIDWPGGKKAHLEYAIDITNIRDMKENIEKLESEVEKVYYDTLTGIYNRRYFDENIKAVASSLSRSNDVLSIMMVDIDYFKKYNDTYGHVQGDECLEIIAKTLQKSTMRKADFVARYGGEEFVAVLPNTDEYGARVIAQKMLRDIQNCFIPHATSDVSDSVTVSIGVVTGHIADVGMVGKFIERADAMLYESKRGGRNRCSYAKI